MSRSTPRMQDLDLDVDQPLFAALQQGDAQVLPELMQRHGRWVRAVIYSALGDGRDVEDVHQQVWVSVWKQARKLDDTRCWRSWLFRMARNAAIDAGRRRTRERSFWSRLMLDTPRRRVASDPTSGMTMVKEEYRRALAVLAELPEIYRQPFVLRHLEGWTYRQISQTLDMPVDTVETRLVRARRLLREKLGPRQTGPADE